MALSTQDFEKLRQQLTNKKNEFEQVTAPQAGVLQTTKDLGIGALKGLGDTAMGISGLGGSIQKGLSRGMDALTGTKDFGLGENSPFQTGTASNIKIEEALKSENTTQKVGKGIEFVAELLFPVGAVAKGLGLTEKGAKVVGASFDNLSTRFASIADDVGEGGGKIKDKLIDLVGGLDDRTKTALKRTTREQFDAVVETGKKAMLDDRNRTPLEFVGDNIITALKQIQSQANSVGKAKSDIMNTAKVGFKTVGNIAQRTALNIQKQFNGIKLDVAESKFVNGFKQELVKLGNNPRLKDVDAIIDMLQDRIYKSGRGSAIEVTDRVTGILRKSLGELNEQVRTLGGEAYAKANKEYADLIETVTEINARLGKEGASAGSFVKRLFSPSDARTKELFEKLGSLTGNDFFKDARLAKFVMEAIGDARSRSLLEELPTTAGIIKKVFEFGKDKLEVPFKAAENIIKKNK